MVDNLLADALEEFLAGCCTPKRVREIEAEPSGDVARALWNEVQDSGFADALIAETQGGAGLGLSDAALVAMACGRHAMPLPMALTLPVRAALASVVEVPSGPTTIAQQMHAIPDTGPITCTAVPYGLAADWVLLSSPSADWLLPTVGAVRQPSGGQGSVAADIRWERMPENAVELPRTQGSANWRATAAAFVAAQMAGAMERLLEMTISYANDRSQFGKPISKLQVIQHQISVMAEQTFATRTAALIGLSGTDVQVDPLRAAIAKSRAGAAAVTVTASSHAVHGAIGVTEEFDLQLYTRRLHEWRGQYGGETYWHQVLGNALIDDTVPPLEFIMKLAAPVSTS
ncbi:MAG: acyl-CoA dehydrogenase family protein [Georgfuchsia sp.]